MNFTITINISTDSGEVHVSTPASADAQETHVEVEPLPLSEEMQDIMSYSKEKAMKELDRERNERLGVLD